jgi:hypothetical protein
MCLAVWKTAPQQATRGDDDVRKLTTGHPMKSPLADEFIEKQEVARLCGVQVDTVDTWRTKARAQPLAYVRVAGRVRYRRADVQAFLAAGRCQPTAKKA